MNFREHLARHGHNAVRRGRFELVRVKRPARSLDASLRVRALDEFAAVTDSLYQADTSFHWRKSADYFSGLTNVWLVFFDGELYGFTASRSFVQAGERILYIDNLNLKPIARNAIGDLTVGGMLVYEMLRAHFPIVGRPMSVVFRTQNPNVYRLAFSVLPEGLSPRLKGARPRDERRSKSVLSAMATQLSPGRPYDQTTSVIKGAYSGYLYGRPLSQSMKATSGLARFWAEHVDLAAGDAVLIAVCPTHREVRRLVYGYVRKLAHERYNAWREALIRRRLHRSGAVQGAPTSVAGPHPLETSAEQHAVSSGIAGSKTPIEMRSLSLAPAPGKARGDGVSVAVAKNFRMQAVVAYVAFALVIVAGTALLLRGWQHG